MNIELIFLRILPLNNNSKMILIISIKRLKNPKGERTIKTKQNLKLKGDSKKNVPGKADGNKKQRTESINPEKENW